MDLTARQVTGDWSPGRRLAAAALALVLAVPSLSAQEGVAVGATAPAAAMETLDGKPADLGQFIGKEPVFIEFWATWCPNCKQLEPRLLEMQKKYAGKMRFIGVAVSANQSPELVRRYIAAHGLQGEQLYDRNGIATDVYDVPATSYIVVINAAGKVVYTGVGGRQNLEAAILKAF